MSTTLSRQTAQKIVDTVKDVCGHNINFINTKGIIFASTDATRIGNFHEIGKRVIDDQKTIEVDKDDTFYGTHRGVNIPITYNREIIAAIGISGDPDEIRQYAVLAQKITSLILREQEIDSFNYNKRNWQNYIIRSLIEGEEMDYDHLSEFLSENGLDIEMQYRCILVRLNARYNPSNLSLIENTVYRTFDQIKAPLYTFIFPDEYVLLIPDEQYSKWAYVFRTLADNYKKILYVGVGSACTIWKQRDSYQTAKITIRSLENDENWAMYDNLDLEILLGDITQTAKDTYLKKTIDELEEEERTLLKTYFENDMSLKDTAEAFYMHKNTLQYKLNRIKQNTGYDPRCFRDAVKLYLAIKIKHLI